MTSVLNETALSEIKSLMGEAFPSLVERFESLCGDYLEKIESGIASGDHQQVINAAHPLKSSSRQLAADKVADLAALIEAQGKEYGTITDDMKNAASNLGDEIKAALAALQST